MDLSNMFKKNRAVSGKSTGAGHRPNVPEGLFRKCNKCGAAIVAEEVKRDYYICPKCGGYFRVPAMNRIQMLCDEGSFEEYDEDLTGQNPMEYRGYEEKLKSQQEKTGLREAVVTGRAKIDGSDVVLGICDGRFWMASMGWAVGEKITRAVERATEERLPVVIFSCSGGARMQEGITSLMQMAKTSAALKRHSDAGLLFISVLTDPTTGGVTASFAMLGDVILAEPNALIGFAGPRVIEQTIRQKLPSGFQRAEFLLEHGFIDGIVKREEMKETLARIIKLHGAKKSGKSAQVCGSNIETCESNAEMCENNAKAWVCSTETCGNNSKIYGHSSENVRMNSEDYRIDQGKNLGDISKNLENVMEANTEKCAETSAKKGIRKLFSYTSENQRKHISAWDRVQLSRKNDRPVGSDYIHSLFTDFVELHGDRYYADDPAIVGGIARFMGQPVTVIAQAKGKNTKDNLHHNFGMPSPEGYRKTLRLMKQAEKFGRPIICFVDTPGAFCGVEAEERGQGEAIARNLFEMSALQVPILSIVIGEGGSGGALAMAVADEVWMLENSVYSVLSPEGFASILWKDSSKAKEAAEVMKLTAEDLYRQGIVEQVIVEPEEFTEETMNEVTDQLRDGISDFLKKYGGMAGEQLCERRYERFRVL